MFISLEMSYWHILKSELSQSPFYSSAQQLGDQSLAALLLPSLLYPLWCVSQPRFSRIRNSYYLGCGHRNVCFALLFKHLEKSWQKKISWSVSKKLCLQFEICVFKVVRVDLHADRLIYILTVYYLICMPRKKIAAHAFW